MKRMTILLSAAALAMVPLTSNAKNQRIDSDFAPIEMGICTCAEPYAVTVDGVDGMQFDCGVSWTDVIDAGATEPDEEADPATYGASFDVEVVEEGAEEPQVLNSDIDLEWSEVCEESAEAGVPGTCTVAQGAAPFVLTNYTGQEVVVEAAVKAFKTGKAGKTPRNFKKERVECTVGDSDPVPAE